MIIKDNLIMILCIAVFYGIMMLLGITCPIKFITGISCPGCGMTRAWLAVLHMDFRAAFTYHPLFLLAIPLGIWFLFHNRMNRTFSNILVYSIGVLFIICYIIRMYLQMNGIVVFEPDKGAVFRVVHRIWNIIKELKQK